MFAPQKTQKQTNDRTNAFCGVRVQNREPTALVLHTMGYLWQNGGLCNGRGLHHHGRAAAEWNGTGPGGQEQCAAAAGSVPAVQRASAAVRGAGAGRCGREPCPAAQCRLHSGAAGGGCTGGRGARQRDAGGRPGGPDAGIHPVLRPAAGPAGPGTDRAARGCRIGARPIDLHLAGLVQMGACPQLEGERLLLTAPAGLHGADITLRFPSVGATETLLLAAALAQGRRPCGVRPGSRRSKIWRHS